MKIIQSRDISVGNGCHIPKWVFLESSGKTLYWVSAEGAVEVVRQSPAPEVDSDPGGTFWAYWRCLTCPGVQLLRDGALPCWKSRAYQMG